MHAVDEQSRRALRLFGSPPQAVRATCGPEQEFFLVDAEFFYRRPDLQTSGRTLFGTKPPKGQEMDDHYFGSIPARVLEYMNEVEFELYRLGVPVTTRHNEVAPGQYEMAPVFEGRQPGGGPSAAHDGHDAPRGAEVRPRMPAAREAVPGGQREREAPSTGPWAPRTRNLLEPGETPHDNMQFLFFCSAVLKAVARHQDLLRASVAHAGNDHRLGANEAPPAIISAFVGDQLQDIFEQIERAGEATTSKASGLLGLGVKVLPRLPKHAGDRNRTSPFAFTGNKWEFRALGSSQSVSWPATVLNTIVAESIDELCTRLEADLEKGTTFDDALRTLLADEIHEFKHVIFNGDNYSDEWVEEAERRGLLNLRSTMDALPRMVDEKNAALFEKYGVLSHAELESRYEIFVEQYFMSINIEGETAQHMAQTMILPAATRYLSELLATAERADELGLKTDGVLETAKKLNALIDRLAETIDALAAQNQELGGDDVVSKAEHMRQNIIPAMNAVRRRGPARADRTGRPLAGTDVPGHAVREVAG